MIWLMAVIGGVLFGRGLAGVFFGRRPGEAVMSSGVAAAGLAICVAVYIATH